MILRPVVSNEQQFASPICNYRMSAACGRTLSDLMNECSRHIERARHPISDPFSRQTGGGDNLFSGLEVQGA
jgi:hypothetical protein